MVIFKNFMLLQCFTKTIPDPIPMHFFAKRQKVSKTSLHLVRLYFDFGQPWQHFFHPIMWRRIHAMILLYMACESKG